MATKIEDWDISEVSGVASGYSKKLELISFKVSYKDSPFEQLSNVPFPCGTTTDDLVRWCAEDTFSPTFDANLEPDPEKPVIHLGRRGLLQKLMDEGHLRPN